VRRSSYGPHSPVVGERGARTRRAILDAARTSFEAKGFHATSIEDVAETAGISRAALYQYFESKEELSVELIRGAAADLLRVIRRLGPIGPTAEGYDNLHWWLGEWAWVQDKYKALYLQAAVVDSPEASLRPLIAESIVSYVSSLTPRLAAAVGDDDIDLDGVATVLPALLFRMNDYRHEGITRTLSDDALLDALATFVQLVLFPSTPAQALTAHTPPRAPRTATPSPRRSRRPDTPGRRPPGATGIGGSSEQASKTIQRILDAATTTFAVRGFHATSVQDVLQAARAGRGTFYKYFDDKTHLLVILAEHCMARLEELARRFVDTVDEADDGQALRTWLAECLALHRRYRGVFRALLQEEASHPALKELRLKSGAAILRAFDDALTGIDRAYPFEVRAGSLVLLALLERGPDYAFGTAYDLADERIVDVLATLIERGLLGRTPTRTRRRAAP
jgi:AcrR family transcriptional regulator